MKLDTFIGVTLLDGKVTEQELRMRRLSDQPHELPSNVFKRLMEQRERGPLTEAGYYPDYRDKPKTKPEFGVFVWNQRGRYPRKDAVKTFNSEKRAQTFAAKGLDKNWVVRELRD